MNIPETPLDNSKRILIFGLGGGFDVFTGLPFVFHWKDKEFVLANYSNSRHNFKVRKSSEENYPEGLISNIPNVLDVLSIGRNGPILVKSALTQILEEYKIDAIMGVDGGVDSLARGDEEDYGTILEDFITLAALSEIELPKILCCAGFGCETEENMNFYRILENMAFLISKKAFYGSFSLINETAFSDYVRECENTWANGRRKSHIQTKIISSILGHFGEDNFYDNVDPNLTVSTENCFISPLSSIFWMFNMQAVINSNMLIDTLKKANTIVDAQILLKSFLKDKTRSHIQIPL